VVLLGERYILLLVLGLSGKSGVGDLIRVVPRMAKVVRNKRGITIFFIFLF